MSLTDTTVKNAKPRDKGYTLSDGGALFLYVIPTGSKLWRYRFRWLGKQQIFSIGRYPRVSLAEARRSRDSAKDMVVQGQHPTQQRKLARISLVIVLDYSRRITPSSPRRCHGKPRTSASNCPRLSDTVVPSLGQANRPRSRRRQASQIPIPS